MKSDSKISRSFYSSESVRIIRSRGDNVDKIMEVLIEKGYQVYTKGMFPERQLRNNSLIIDFDLLSGLLLRHHLHDSDAFPVYHDKDLSPENWCGVDIYKGKKHQTYRKVNITDISSAAREIDKYVKEALSQLK